MKRSVTFWAIVLIVVGVLLLLSTLGIIPGGSGLFWPLLLVAAGAWLIWAAVNRPGTLEVEQVSIPLGDATRAQVSIHHGAGSLIISPDAPAGQLASGSFRGGLDYRTEQAGGLLEVRMRIPDQGSRWANPWSWGSRGLDWNVALSSELPLELQLDTGAGTLEADLRALRLNALRLKTGASSSKVTLPANAGYTRVEVEGGAASVSFRVPAGVAARVVSRGGASSTNVDLDRFARAGDGYQSEQYETAANKVDIQVSMGAGSVEVR
jgi:hypothetical protein